MDIANVAKKVVATLLCRLSDVTVTGWKVSSLVFFFNFNCLKR